MLLRSIAEKIRFVNEFFPSLEMRERGRFVNEFFPSLEMRERGRVSKSDMIVSGKRWLIDAVVEWPMPRSNFAWMDLLNFEGEGRRKHYFN